MGILDDAIREHLDLKRRHGADPAEIERAEREALGPVRRTPDDVAGGEEEQDLPVAGEQGEYANGDEPGWDESFDHDNDLFAHEPPEAPPIGRAPEAPEPAQPDSQPAPELDEPDDSDEFATREHNAGRDLFDSEEDAPPPPPPVAPPAPPAAPSQAPEQAAPPPPPAQAPPSPPPNPPRSSESQIGEETAEYDVEGELEKDPDVLEETPEFLQDTPDHDRLWFEQRPPRDFDFDG